MEEVTRLHMRGCNPGGGNDGRALDMSEVGWLGRTILGQWLGIDFRDEELFGTLLLRFFAGSP